ncbi:MAG: phenylacetate--CoA ligase family protein [Saprospiraceae bacterium]|nr:phenylacetate--CoA ligase family protein [Saprospiraceae bacterium]
MPFNFRKYFFVKKEWLTGSPIFQYQNQISSCLEMDERKLKIYQDEQINKIIQHAVATVPFYKKFRNSGLHDFPVVNKNIIRDQFESFRSDMYEDKTLKRVVTSGSTGTPFEVLQNRNKVFRNSADTIYFSKLAGYELGYKLLYCKIWNEKNKKSWYELFLQNIVPVNVMLNDDNNLEHFIKIIKLNKKPKSIIAYASYLDAILKYCLKNNVNIRDSKINSVIAISEALDSHTKRKFSDLAGVEIVSRYSNVENGIIGQQSIEGSENFILNHASYFIEILNENSDFPVELGVPGRIVITDFYNEAMPMIRYDTGDIGVIMLDQKTNKIVLSKVEGRKMDQIYDTRERPISSFTITNQMWKYTEIRQYQFIQISKFEYKFILSINSEFNHEKKLTEEFKNYLGENASIIVEYVNEIPLLNSGKRKKVRNEYIVQKLNR